MLLRFSVRNYRSISEKVELLLTATPLSDLQNGLIEVEEQGLTALPSAIIYGANASGKSNLLSALKFMSAGVVGSYASDTAKIGRVPFRLAQSADSATSMFECDFVLKSCMLGDRVVPNVRMTYGFEVSDTEVLEEWLYAYPKRHRQVWFHRNTNEPEPYYFGSELKGQNKLIGGNTRPNSLFLSTASANNHAQLRQVVEFFRGISFKLSNEEPNHEIIVAPFLENTDLREKMIEFLKAADVGICSADVKTVKRSEKMGSLFEEMQALVTKHFPNNSKMSTAFNAPEERKKISLGHTGSQGVVFFSLNDESRGTLAFLNLMGWVLITLSSGGVLVVDELESSLHPLLCRKIVQLFNITQSNPNGAQLIFSTHDTSLLSSELVRRDQVWFAEKDKGGSTNLYPLSDLKLRKSDNFQKGYLQGRFGAIPFLGDFADFFRDEDK